MKYGIPYFPLDCVLDEKFELIEAEFGLTGFAIVVKLLQRIYGGQGYYCEWTNEVALLFAKRHNAGGSVVSEIVEASIRRGIFDCNMFEKYQILTSKGIQGRYLKAVDRRKQIEIKKEYLLLKCDQISENVRIIEENVNILPKNDDISKQRKEEKRREKKSKEKNICADAPHKQFVKPTLEEIHAYCDEKGYPIDTERFYDHYESNGWMVGKTKMKDWKAAVRNWWRNETNGGIKGTHTKGGAAGNSRKMEKSYGIKL